MSFDKVTGVTAKTKSTKINSRLTPDGQDLTTHENIDISGNTLQYKINGKKFKITVLNS